MEVDETIHGTARPSSILGKVSTSYYDMMWYPKRYANLFLPVWKTYLCDFISSQMQLVLAFQRTFFLV